jgi:enoyl-CoA hydratase
VLKAVPADRLDDEVDALAHRMATVPQNQLMMQKLMVNQALYNMGLMGTQMIATVFDGITRHSPEGLNFKRRSEKMGWKHAVDETRSGHLRLDHQSADRAEQVVRGKPGQRFHAIDRDGNFLRDHRGLNGKCSASPNTSLKRVLAGWKFDAALRSGPRQNADVTCPAGSVRSD